MSDYQMSLFGETMISDLLVELNRIHKYETNESVDEKYSVYRYNDGDILLGVYYKKLQDKEVREKILYKSVYLEKQADKTYVINHFDRECLMGLIDHRDKSILLESYINRTRMVDDL